LATFTDSNGNEWAVAFDAFSLDDVRTELDVDLADLSAAGWYAITSREPTLAKSLAIICKGQHDVRQLSGDDFPKALAAMEAAALDFFPPKKWSEMQTNLRMKSQTAQAQDAAATLQGAIPLAEAFMRLPPQMQEDIVREQGGESSDLQRLRELASVSGPASTPSTPATDSPESAAELQPAV
jgi:hypothetical protein